MSGGERIGGGMTGGGRIGGWESSSSGGRIDGRMSGGGKSCEWEIEGGKMSVSWRMDGHGTRRRCCCSPDALDGCLIWIWHCSLVRLRWLEGDGSLPQ